ncbi:dynamin family protein [Pseudomonas jilinensis]|uniref:Dynamin N-terminal domain-containing protein n=1 Tax=Pseudomonas jilinensis TaxID=2078689 RepID=A0A396S5M1_9PSED|nr:dynamin family protein [Pseudomonas jilinensis]RHW21391.1 hypothetical protein C2846_09755 [Pseudomonas jilinensis]
MILLALQEEIKTLIEKQQGLMTRLKDEEAIWKSEATGTSFSPAELDKQISALASDNVKVQALESTIAVIGTMKAGKSTTINALIGEEVLPHRLTAMTTLPTLIRHKPGQKEPVLKLHKLDVFKALLAEVNAQAATVEEQGADLSKINEALDTIKNRSGDIRAEYVGKDEIHQALFLINDTLRLAGHDGFNVNLDNYLTHFTDIQSLPTVEIEFRCLAGSPEGRHAGSLALLDTPGPNEAGQSTVLKRILSEQIEKNASMVLLVMNYTQLNTEQDLDIRNQIRGIKEVFRERSFVVVNRFDEKKHNDLDADRTKKLSSDLLNDSVDDDFITPDEVFPVSSHYAFIVERVNQQIDEGVPISAFIKDEINKDFIKAAFGELDDDEADELTYEQIKVKSDRLYKRSGYAVFTRNMLEKAYTKAGENSLQAALARLKENSGKIDRFTAVVRGGLAQEMDALTNSIERTQKLVQSIQFIYNKLDEVKGVGIAEYRANAQATLKQHVGSVKDQISVEFSRERAKLIGKLKSEVDEKSTQKEQQQRRHWSGAAKKELLIIESDLNNLHAQIEKHSQGDGVLEFGSDRNAAVKFAEKASAVLNSIFMSMVNSLQQQLNELEDNTKHEIQVQLFGQLEQLCTDYEVEMRGKGFEFNVSLADSFNLDVLGGGGFNLKPSDAVESYSETVTHSWKKKVKREGWLHKTLKVLSFGKRSDYAEVVETSTQDVKRYKVVLNDYVEEAQALADGFYADVEARLAKQFEDKLVPAVDEVFAKVISDVKGIEEALENSKKLKDESVSIISRVKEMMDTVKKDNLVCLKRIEIAIRGIDALKFGK